MRSTGSCSSRPRLPGVQLRAGVAAARNRVDSAPENEARARSSRSGPSVDESVGVARPNARPSGLSHVSARFPRRRAATAVRGRRCESARRAAWPLAPAVSRFFRSAAPATAVTSTADRPAPTSRAATASAARGAAIATVWKVASITGTTSARAASAPGNPCAWGITVLSPRPRAAVCPPRSRRPPRMQRSRIASRRQGPRRATARFAAGACTSSRSNADRSAGSCPPAQVRREDRS